MSSPPTVHVIDSHVSIFRSYFAMPEMFAPDGTPTSAVHGFANSLLRLWADRKATHAAACFDHATKSFRNEIEPEYKANRGEPDEDLELQFALCKEVAEALGFACFEVANYEADDVIATIAEPLARRGAEVVVCTTDKDLSQLVRDDGSIVLGDLNHSGVVDAFAVREKFGVDPSQIPDFLGLVGDAVDNLPGVPGIGKKTAAAALRAFDAIEGIPADPEKWVGLEVRGAKRAASLIDEHRRRALLTKELATVRRDVPGVVPRLDDLRLRGALRSRAEPLFARLGWGAMLERIPRWRPES